MNPSRIEKAIDDIYDYVENCKPSKLYPTKAVVERGELYDLLDELRMCAPEEIKRYQKIIAEHHWFKRRCFVVGHMPMGTAHSTSTRKQC